jgi:hypothetical protein
MISPAGYQMTSAKQRYDRSFITVSSVEDRKEYNRQYHAAVYQKKVAQVKEDQVGRLMKRIADLELAVAAAGTAVAVGES